MDTRKKNLSTSADERFDKVLLREKKLKNTLHLNINTYEEKRFEQRNLVSSRPPRVILVKDDSILIKKASRILKNNYPDIHIFNAENMTQALVELEQREYDLILLNVDKHMLYPELFMDVMQRQYSYLNILFLGRLPQLKSNSAFEKNYYHLSDEMDTTDTGKVFRQIFSKHRLLRNKIISRNKLSPVDQKYHKLNSAR